MRHRLTVLSTGLALGVLAGCTTITPTDDPVYLRVQDLEARLMRIERVVNNESLIELAGQIETMRSETQALRGEVETLRFETESAASRQRELYLDIDQRLQSLEQTRGAMSGQSQQGFGAGAAVDAAGGGVAGGAAAGSSRVVSGSDQDNYQAAFELLQNRRYADAARAFTSFLGSFPQSPLAANAQYWLAETHYVQRQFAAALPEFQKVLDAYPRSDKIADSLLKIGYCNYELQRWNEARTALQRVMREYPGTTAAQLAVARLERLEQEAG